MSDHEHDGENYGNGCYGCDLQAKRAGIGVGAMPSRMNNRPPRDADPVWERGIAGERRRDGSFMPYLTPDRSVMHVKEYGEKRADVDAQIKRLKSDPNVFASERK